MSGIEGLASLAVKDRNPYHDAADRAGWFGMNKDLLKFALLCAGQTVTQGNVFLCQILTCAKKDALCF